MAPVSLEAEVRYLPTVVVAAHLLAVASLTSTVGFGLYKSWNDLAPSQDTRSRHARRAKLVPVFAGLAALALIFAGFSSVQYATLSYQVWADQRGIEVPKYLGGSPSLAVETNVTKLHVTRWLADTPIYRDAFEIVAEKARRFWWGQQIDLAMVPWSLLLAIEGRRRNMPFLWAYLALAHLVNLSFAQNLFYVALLLTPSPLPANGEVLPGRLARIRNAIFPEKPANWSPHAGLFLGLIVLNYAAVFSLPYAAETPPFGTVALLSRALNFALLTLPGVVPESWGTVHAHPHDAYGAFNTLFRVASSAAIVLHGKATFAGLAFSDPGSYYHRHSIRLPLDTAERSTWERTTTAAGKVLGSTMDHPVVAAVGRDVLLCGLSLGLWAAVRALNSSDVLVSAIPFYGTPGLKSAADDVASLASSAVAAVKEKTASPAPSEVDMVKDEPDSPPPTVRRSGRAAKSRVASTSSTADTHAETAAPATRKRGRPRKVKAEPEEDQEDAAYQPTPAVEVAAAEGDKLPAEELDWESAALAWGLTTVGGLGWGSAGVFGAECVSR